MSFGIGIAAIIFGLIRVPDLMSQASAYGVPWSVAAVAAFVLPSALLVPLSFRAPLWLLRALSLTTGAGFIIIGLTVVLVLPGGLLPEGVGNPWPLTISALATSVVAIWLPALPTGAYLVVAVGIVEGIRLVIAPQSDLGLMLLDTAYTLLFNLIFAALALNLRAVAARVDAAMAAAIHDTSAVAAADARVRERARMAALVHDRVLVTLLAAAAPDPVSRAESSSLAASALELLDHPQSGDDEQLSARDLMWRLQSVTTDLSPLAVFTHTLDPAAGMIPVDAAEAIIEATSEALRNSHRHAERRDGEPVSRAVNVHVDPHRYEVTVIDDGRGFDPDAIRPDRLGIAVSIRSRMAAVRGGTAFVIAEPGVGTRIVARWSNDE
jgi:signal transduction histidine kinase